MNMVELFNNEQNKELVFNVDTQGMEKSKLEVRMLVITKENVKNLFFTSDVLDGKVRFSLPPLQELNESQQGKLRLEVVADGEYFKPWESDFTIKTKRSLTVTAPIEEAVAAPTKKVVMELTGDTITEKPKSKAVIEAVKPVPAKQKPIVTPKAVKNSQPDTKIVEKKTSVSDPDYKPLSFEDFLNNKN